MSHLWTHYINAAIAATYFGVCPLTLNNISVQNFVAQLSWTKKEHNRFFSVIGHFGRIWQRQGPQIERWAHFDHFFRFFYKNLKTCTQRCVKIWYKNIVRGAHNRDFSFLWP